MIGRGRKGLSTKIHLALSGAGVQSACLSEGQRVDMKIFPMLWELGDWTGIEYVIADKGYTMLPCVYRSGKPKKSQLFQDALMLFFQASKISINLIIAHVQQ
jgi:hypothetical protein